MSVDPNTPSKPGLKKLAPYWYPYRTMAKGRWYDREILELVSTEFRDRSVEYYRYALESGVTTVNGKIAKPGTIVRNGDRIENIVHRHEPPVTSTPVKILLEDKEREFIVINKPGSIPVHASGRYFKHSLVEILKDEFGYKNVHTVNRLDRLTSGLMIIATSPDRARILTEEFTKGTIRKEYIARVKGEFPSEEVTCSEPLLTIDRQMGLNVVHPEGKPAKTIFKRMHYDSETDTSVLHCRPLTGRSHQLRVHLQFLGHPIANDAVYSEERIWGKKLGKGGIDHVPSDERSAPVPPPQLQDSPAEGRQRQSFPSPANLQASMPVATSTSTSPLKGKKNPAYRTKGESKALAAALEAQIALATADLNSEEAGAMLLPRETGHDIGMGSPVPLSLEAVGIITRLRNQKDEDEDWSRWRDVIFRNKGSLNPTNIPIPSLPPGNKRRRGGNGPTQGARADVSEVTAALQKTVISGIVAPPEAGRTVYGEGLDATTRPSRVEASADGGSEATADLAPVTEPSDDPLQPQVIPQPSSDSEELLYCPECYLPLHPDPKPEKLYIFLHALRYTTSLGSFETDLPEWAAPGYVWE